MEQEAGRFVEIYDSGMGFLEAKIGRMPGGNFPGEVAFTLHDTYGFLVEVTREVLADRGISLDEAGFEKAMNEQRERARDAMQGPRAGGRRFSGRGDKKPLRRL